MRVFKTIYLTGAPASGKTTASHELVKLISDIELWSYSDHLIRYIEETKNIASSHESLRERWQRLMELLSDDPSISLIQANL
jgi:tRNA uridine 5-carbamoylmethylation protein Kti12